jgi:tRNA/tmRNA/rRNA uracil-C5-methylase (TrmA/RlmC/RlmD family)
VARYLQVVVERSSRTAQVVLVGNSATAAPVAGALAMIRERLGEELHRLWFNAQSERTNTILGAGFEHECGPPAVVENFGGADVHYPPGAFGQNNLVIAERIVGHVRERVPPGSTVAEFYAGVGAIGLSLLERVTRIRMNEVGPASLQGLAMGLDALPGEDRDKVEVIAGAAGARADAAVGADVVIADPPRKGLDPALVKQLGDDPPQRFVYVSCGLDSLLADTAQLTANGGLKLRELSAFNLMPYTGHVETVACFERA